MSVETRSTNGQDRQLNFRSSARTAPCPDCGSKPAYQPHDDGGGYCHKCEKNFPFALTPSIKHRKHQEPPRDDIALEWNRSRQVLFSSHGYLYRKGGLTGFGLHKRHSKLLVPIRLVTGELVSVQTITANGTKKFARGSHLEDSFFSVGILKRKIFICEGVATALTIYTATREFTVAAMNAGRLLRVAKIIRKAYPDAEIIICADNDGD